MPKAFQEIVDSSFAGLVHQLAHSAAIRDLWPTNPELHDFFKREIKEDWCKPELTSERLSALERSAEIIADAYPGQSFSRPFHSAITQAATDVVNELVSPVSPIATTFPKTDLGLDRSKQTLPLPTTKI